MSGTYFAPLQRIFLNLSGGTVTGDTLFTQSVSATTFYSGSTNLYDIFAVGANASLTPTYVGYGSSSSGLTGNSNFTYNETLGVISSTLPAFYGYQANSSTSPVGKFFKAFNAGGQMWPILQLNRGDGTTITPQPGVGAALSFGLPDGVSVFSSSEDNVVIGGIYDIQATTAASSRNTAFVVQTQSGGTLANKLKVSYSGTTSYVPFKVQGDGTSSQVLASFGDYVYIQDRLSGFADRSYFTVGGMYFHNAAGTPLISSSNYLEFSAPTHFFVSSPNMYFNDTKLYIGTYPHTNIYNFEVSGSSKLTTLTASTVYIPTSNAEYNLRIGGNNIGIDGGGTFLNRADTYGTITAYGWYYGGSSYPQYFTSNGAHFGASDTGYGAPTAYVDISGAKTTSASLRIRTGVTVTSPNDGDIWNDGTFINFQSGIQSFQGASVFNVGLDTQYGLFTAIHLTTARTNSNYFVRGNAVDTIQINSGSRMDFAIGGVLQNIVYNDHNRIARPMYVGDVSLSITPTAFIDIQSASTSQAQLRLRSGATVSSPNEGDIWNDGSHLYGRFGGQNRELDNYLPTHQIAFGSSTSGVSGSSYFWYHQDSVSAGHLYLTSPIQYGLIDIGASRIEAINDMYISAGNNGNSQIILRPSFIERARINNTGLGIGTETPVYPLHVIGRTNTTSLSATTISGNTIQSDALRGSTERMVQADTGGTLYASQEIVSGIVTDPTAITLLTTSSNWNMAGIYTGTTITNTYQGQFYGDTGNTYVYLALADNYFARIPRV